MMLNAPALTQCFERVFNKDQASILAVSITVQSRFVRTEINGKEWALINLGKYDPQISQIDADSREKSADKNAQVIYDW